MGTIYRNGQLSKLLVEELNKYLDFHNLSLRGKKVDKVRVRRRVTAHPCHQLDGDLANNADATSDESDADLEEEESEEEDNGGDNL